MQIEKPKSTLSPALIFVGIVVGLGILSLPFLAKTGTTTSKPAHEVSASDSALAPAKQDISVTQLKEPQSSESLVDESVPSPVEALIDVVDPAPAEEIPLTLKEQMEPVKNPEPSTISTTVGPNLKEPSALLTSFYGDVKVVGPNGERKAEKNRQILKGETIEVGATGEAVLQLQELYVLRLKSNTKLTQLEPKRDEAFSGKERVTYRFKLDQGSLLGTTKYRGDKTDNLNLLVKDRVFDVQDSTFRVELSDASPWVGVLRGSMKSSVEDIPSQKPFMIHALEKEPLTATPVTAPVQVSEQEWGLLRETYEMNMKTAAEEAGQVELSKRAGNFFESVFDHGTFYTENVGYTVRDFYEDKASGMVYLEAEYDVFPSNSFVGLYVLTRELDASNYGGLRFDVRRKPGEGYPDRFYIEIKSKGQIINRFEITDIKPGWEARQIDFFTQTSTPITEVTVVFLNESIGKGKKGFIQMRNVQMVPLTEQQKSERTQATLTKSPARLPKTLASAPASLRQAVVTLPMKKARTVSVDEPQSSVPYHSDTTRKIAQEVPKVVSFDDITQ